MMDIMHHAARIAWQDPACRIIMPSVDGGVTVHRIHDGVICDLIASIFIDDDQCRVAMHGAYAEDGDDGETVEAFSVNSFDPTWVQHLP